MKDYYKIIELRRKLSSNFIPSVKLLNFFLILWAEPCKQKHKLQLKGEQMCKVLYINIHTYPS